jgi:hypothetical protein
MSTGTFQSGSVAVPSALNTFVESGDFNSDGAVDLLYRNSFSGFSVSLLGNGDGTFGPAQPGGGLITNNIAVVGDFNRDGKLDVASGDASVGSASLRRELPRPPGPG